jgi:lipoprotein-anchoring transpeptidase ErfK/SrfK
MMGVVARRPLALVAALAFVLVACATSGNGIDTSASPQPSVAEEPTGPTGDGVVESPRPEPAPLLPDDGFFVALPDKRYTPMWNEPGKSDQPDFAFDTHNPYQQVAPLLIEDAARRDGEAWYKLLLPLRPNGTTAWVRADDVRIQRRQDRIEVDLSKRMLWHYRGDEVVDRFQVGVGTDQYPTGTGQFYIWVKVPYENANNPYGIMALGLSGFSPVLSDWPGEGRMAVHGTPYASDRGQAVSHGCVRVFNDDMRSLLDLPLGTPVEIRE